MRRGSFALLFVLALARRAAAGDAAAEPEAEASPKVAPEAKQKPGSLRIPDILPLELTAFGDIQYRFQRHLVDEFRVGSLELDAALTLAPYAIAATAIGYDAE